MNIIGIIAEYNPFHNGHLYQIEEIRKRTNADYIVVAMSGNFVQRGTPAIVDKYCRTRMALSCGADLVVELPALWSTASAEDFASAGVSLFTKMGCVTGLCFGAETANLSLLQKIASVLCEEPIAFSEELSLQLKKGQSFPSARALALLHYFSNYATSMTCTMEELQDILNAPNNILAIEYLKAIKRFDSPLVPHLIQRKGAGYHDTDIEAANASATAIREFIQSQTPAAVTASCALNIFSSSIAKKSSNIPWDKLKTSMPANALSLLEKENCYVTADDFSSILNYLLLLYTNTDSLANFSDCNVDIANRLSNNLPLFKSFTQFAEATKSKDVTYTRMSRILLHILLHFTKEDYLCFRKKGYTPYIRPLGFQKKSAGILSSIKKESSIPLLSKLADASSILDADSLELLQKDIFAANLYEQIAAQKKMTTPRNEFSREIVIL